MAQLASRPLAFDEVRETPICKFLRIGTQIVDNEKFGRLHEGWKALWLAVAGVLAITLTWNVLVLGLHGFSY